jgi:hypothetical protein
MTIKSTLMAIACLGVFSFAQPPTLRVATQNNATPGYTQVQNGNSFCPAGTYSQNMMQQDANASTSGGMGYTTSYIVATEIELSGADSRYNFKLTTPVQAGASDSIRRRGNSTATVSKVSFRLKFNKKHEMLGRPAEKSWALIANYYDPSLMQSALAFYLGKKLNLEFTPNGYHVKVNVANQNRGVYLLTDQIQRSTASVDIDKEDGWLAEFDYHCATSTTDQKRFYHTGSNRYNLNVKIREPDLDDLPLNSSRQPDGTCLDFVKSDLNALLDKMKESNFPNNGYRDYIDLESYAKYIMIQLFLDNQDFNGLASSSTLLGSNYAYKNKGEKIKAGPLWDFDLAAGSPMNMGFGARNFFSNFQEQTEPRNAFYKRLWEDPVFRFKYKKIWNDNKTHFERVGSVVIDSITNFVAGSVAGNIGDGVSNVTEASYRTHTGNLKTWWNNRINYFGQQVNNMSAANSDVAETAPAAALNSKRNCREAVSSSSSVATTPSSSSVATTPSSSSSSTTSGGNCAYQASWCGNTVPTNNSTAKPATGQCVFVRDYTALTISGGGGTVLINGTTCTGSNTNCTANKPSASDGGYYIYVQAGTLSNSQPYTVTAGTPVCDDTTPILSLQTNFSNLPQGTKVEVYNLQGKLVYSGYPENPSILRILVQTKGIYIVRTTLGSDRKIQRLVVK